MSEALSYLLKTRKEALGPYFEFLKQSGKHLDMKTRSLLSVITKVDAQTEKGFRQYLVKALQAGNTADEILDALLVCIPTLGLTKIIWCVEIILEMDIPEFRPENLGSKKTWHEIIPITGLSDG